MHSRTIRGHHSKITDLAINKNNSVLMSSSEDGWIMFWDITPLTYPSFPQSNRASYHFLACCCKHTRFIAQLRYDENTDLLFSVADDGYVRAWNVGQVDPLFHRLNGPLTETDLCVMSFNHGKNGYSPEARGTEVLPRDNSVLFCDIDPCSRYIATGTADGSVWIWRLPLINRDGNGVSRCVRTNGEMKCSGLKSSVLECL